MSTNSGSQDLRKATASAIHQESNPGKPRRTLWIAGLCMLAGAGYLFPNEFVNARLLVNTLRGVSLVPAAAIQRNGGQAFVYVVDPATETVHLRNITVSETNENLAAASGVSPGETVVINGFDRLEDGAKVKTSPAPRK